MPPPPRGVVTLSDVQRDRWGLSRAARQPSILAPQPIHQAIPRGLVYDDPALGPGSLAHLREHDRLSSAPRAGHQCEKSWSSGTIVKALTELIDELIASDEERRSGSCCRLERVGHRRSLCGV